MRLVLDTNVFISGVFFVGPPFDILKSWRAGQVEIVVSVEILHEYRRVGVELSEKYTTVDLTPFLELLISHASVVHAPPWMDVSAPILMMINLWLVLWQAGQKLFAVVIKPF